MKYLFFIILAVQSLFADYSIVYNNLKLGTIKSLDTLEQNYLKINVTNPIARFMLGEPVLILYNQAYVLPQMKRNITFKKDRYEIITVLKKGLSQNLKKERIYYSDSKYLEIKKEKNYTFKYISKGYIKTFGDITIENDHLRSIIDKKNNIKIIKSSI